MLIFIQELIGMKEIKLKKAIEENVENMISNGFCGLSVYKMLL